jgi:monoamine oxidase
MAGESIDIAIVGGGVSGIYSAWRLKRRLPEKKIVVFEGSNRIGGRLLSVRPPDIDDMVAELGGMRILPAVQPLIKGLLAELNQGPLQAGPIETYDFPVDEPQNIAYLRGVHIRLQDFTANPGEVPYHFSFLERGGTAGSIIVNAIEQIVPGITAPNLSDHQRREMARNTSFAGQPLYQQGFWNVLLRVISGEAYQLGVNAGGYESTLSNWNAADALPWYLADFGIKPAYLGFKEGFDQVPKALANLFLADGGDVRLETRVDGFDWVGGQPDSGVVLQVGNDPVMAQTLILAMPRRSLELLAPSSPPLRDIVDLIRAVTPRPLFKIFTTYADPWWRAAGYMNANGDFVPVEAGRTVTDLPVRQIYYWPTDDGKPATRGPSMLMASYDDGANIGFWDGLRPRRGLAWIKGREVPEPDTPFISDYDGDPDLLWHQYKPTQKMVDEVARQLATVHGLPYTPVVRNAVFRDWGDDPFGGGWNNWNIGVKSWEVKERIIQPLTPRRLYICGEAYSDAQGWVEGALQTADAMLGRILSL